MGVTLNLSSIPRRVWRFAARFRVKCPGRGPDHCAVPCLRAESRDRRSIVASQRRIVDGVGVVRALSTAEASALLPLAAQHRKDLCKPAVLGFVLKRVVVLGDLVCHVVGRPHLTDEPRAAHADREMEADPERVPRGQLPVDERARAVGDIPAGQHFRSVLSTTSRERDPRGSFSLRSAERLLRKISLRRCHISPARVARSESRARCRSTRMLPSVSPRIAHISAGSRPCWTLSVTTLRCAGGSASIATARCSANRRPATTRSGVISSQSSGISFHRPCPSKAVRPFSSPPSSKETERPSRFAWVRALLIRMVKIQPANEDRLSNPPIFFRTACQDSCVTSSATARLFTIVPATRIIEGV